MQERAHLSIVEQAANWHVYLHSGQAGDADREAFAIWVSENPAHADAYRKLQALWQRFDGLDPVPAMTALQSAMQATSKQSKRFKRVAGSAAALMLAIGAGWATLHSSPAKYWLAEHRTPVGQHRVVELSDHSRITLNTDSAFDVDFSENQRRITLHRGEVMVEVAKDALRPFIVETDQGTARALGTQFVVRRMPDATSVAVVESVVEVCTAEPVLSQHAKQCVTLHAGEGTELAVGRVQAAVPVDIDALAGWTMGSLIVNNRPLVEVLQELERYRHGRIHFNEADIESLRVSGLLPLDDTDRALDLIAGLLPVRITHYPLVVVVAHR